MHGGFGSGGEGFVHPGAGAAFLGAGEEYALDLEFVADEIVEIVARGEDIAAEDGGGFIFYGEFLAEALVNGLVEEGDLAFVVVLEIEKAIAFDAAARDELHLGDFQRWVLPRENIVMPEIIVPGRDVQLEHAEIGAEDHEIKRAR